MFAHCYKQQGGWKDVISRWEAGQPTGMLYDLEFLQDERGRRVAAFGYHAGFAGAAVGTLALAKQVGSDGEKDRLGEIHAYPNEGELIKYVKGQMSVIEQRLGRKPRALVIGALGRCGRGAVDFFKAAGFEDDNIAKWDMAETQKGGPFNEILEGEPLPPSAPVTPTLSAMLMCEPLQPTSLSTASTSPPRSLRSSLRNRSRLPATSASSASSSTSRATRPTRTTRSRSTRSTRPLTSRQSTSTGEFSFVRVFSRLWSTRPWWHPEST